MVNDLKIPVPTVPMIISFKILKYIVHGKRSLFLFDNLWYGKFKLKKTNILLRILDLYNSRLDRKRFFNPDLSNLQVRKICKWIIRAYSKNKRQRPTKGIFRSTISKRAYQRAHFSLILQQYFINNAIRDAR